MTNAATRYPVDAMRALRDAVALANPHLDHDFTARALMKRGANFFVCHNALAGVSTRFASSTGIPHSIVLHEWTTNLLPGFLVVPSGAMVVQLAQEEDWRLYPVTD